jgi:hypothetical protein
VGVDYGVRPARRIPWLWIIGIILGITLVSGLTTREFLKRRTEAVATAKAWAITGPPCPTVSAAEFEAKKYRLRASFDYGGATFARTAGHVDCAAVVPKGGTALTGAYPVCQFTSPAVVKLTTSKGEFYFVPGAGQPATVSAPDGVGQCVMASKFTLN